MVPAGTDPRAHPRRGGDWSANPWLRVWAFALGLLALSMLLVAPAARGLTPGPGDRLWAHWLDGADHTLDAIIDVAEAPNGALWAAGVTNDDWASGADILLIRQTPSAGTGSWTRSWDAGQSRAEYFGGLVVDGDSNAVVAATTETLLTQRDWTLVKHSPDGTLMWQEVWGGMGSDTALDAVGDAAGNVYVCGTFEVSPTVTDWKVVKFRAGTGTAAWTYTYSAPAAVHPGDMPLAIDIDGAGNLYVTGTSANASGVRDVVVVKVSPKGARLWARRIDGPSHLADQGVAIIALPSGGVYVAAESWTGTAKNQLLLVRLTSSGSYAWATKWRTWHDPAIAGLTDVEGLELDGSGNVYLAGFTWDPNITDQRGYVQKRDGSGRLRWVRYYRPAGVDASGFYDVAVSSVGRVWAVGSVTPTGGTQDWLLARYETDGSRKWVSTFDTPSDHLADWANAVTLCGSKALFAGGVMGTSTNDDAGTAKYLR